MPAVGRIEVGMMMMNKARLVQNNNVTITREVTVLQCGKQSFYSEKVVLKFVLICKSTAVDFRVICC